LSQSIRQYREADLNEVKAIEGASFPDPWPAGFFNYLHQKSPELLLVALDGGTIAGYVVGELREIMFSGVSHQFKVGHILNIAVDASQRQRGIGTLLMDEIEGRFRERNATKATLEVRESNGTARAFYIRRGYEEMGRVSAYYADEDAIIMGKNLKPER